MLILFRPGVTLGYSFLHSMVEFVGGWTSKEQVQTNKETLWKDVEYVSLS